MIKQKQIYDRIVHTCRLFSMWIVCAGLEDAHEASFG